MASAKLLAGLLGDGDVLVAVGEDLFGDADVHDLPRARGAFRSSTGADVVVVFATSFTGGGAGVKEDLDPAVTSPHR